MKKPFKKIILGLASLLAIGGLSACGQQADPVPGDKNWIDYTTNGSVKLGLDY